MSMVGYFVLLPDEDFRTQKETISVALHMYIAQVVTLSE